MQTKVDEGEIELKIYGTRIEFRDLYEELHTWTPGGGWSKAAEQFFLEVARAGGLDVGARTY